MQQPGAVPQQYDSVRHIESLTELLNDHNINIHSDSSDLDVFQKLLVRDNFYQSTFTECYASNVITSATDVSQATIQGQTTGWVRTDEMYLSVPIVLSVCARAVSNATYEYNDPAFIYPPQRITAAAQPDYALFEAIDSIRIYLGRNNIEYSPQTASKLGLKASMADLKLDNDSMYYLGLWGLPTGNLFAEPSSFGTTNANTSACLGSSDGFINCNSSKCTPRIKQAWTDLIYSTSYYCPNGYNNRLMPTNVPGQTQGGGKCIQIDLALPLRWISHFFRAKQYLPPGFDFKIDFRGYFDQVGPTPINPQLCLVSNGFPFEQNTAGPTYTVPGSIVGACTNPFLPSVANYTIEAFWATAGINFNSIKLIYPSHTLRQPLQQLINERRITIPLTYNYEAIEQYALSFNQENTQNGFYIISKDIVISSQRPTVMFFRITDATTNSGVYGWRAPQNSVGGVYTLGACGAMLTSNSINIKDSLTYLASAGSSGVPNLPTGNPQTFLAQYPQITTIGVLCGNKTQYYYYNYDNVYPLAGIIYPPVYDVLTNMIHKDDYNSYTNVSSEKLSVPGHIEGSFSGYLATTLFININPGVLVDRQTITSDNVNLTIRVTMTFSTAVQLTPAKVISIWKKSPEQLAIDVNNNAIKVAYPLLTASEKFLSFNSVTGDKTLQV